MLSEKFNEYRKSEASITIAQRYANRDKDTNNACIAFSSILHAAEDISAFCLWDSDLDLHIDFIYESLLEELTTHTHNLVLSVASSNREDFSKKTEKAMASLMRIFILKSALMGEPLLPVSGTIADLDDPEFKIRPTEEYLDCFNEFVRILKTERSSEEEKRHFWKMLLSLYALLGLDLRKIAIEVLVDIAFIHLEELGVEFKDDGYRFVISFSSNPCNTNQSVIDAYVNPVWDYATTNGSVAKSDVTH